MGVELVYSTMFMPLNIIRNDITKLEVSAIVNAANTQLRMGGGVCGAIFSAAGVEKLQRACDKLAPINTGDAVITKGYALPAKYIIHAAGPVYSDGSQNEELLLRACYRNALNLAMSNQCESIAFPIISSGIYGYPKAEALLVATSEIREWLRDNEMDVYLVVFDKEAFVIMSDLHDDVKSFIDQNYVDEMKRVFGRGSRSTESYSLPLNEEFNSLELSDMSQLILDDKRIVGLPSRAKEKMPKQKVGEQSSYFKDAVERLDEPFSTTLLRLIDNKGRTDVEIYKRANLDRKHFSKIRTGKGYMPSKKTVVALAIALELSLAETRDLLERAGFALSRSMLFDVIIEYFISRKRYDIFEINNVLFEYDQPLLGG